MERLIGVAAAAAKMEADTYAGKVTTAKNDADAEERRKAEEAAEKARVAALTKATQIITEEKQGPDQTPANPDAGLGGSGARCHGDLGERQPFGLGRHAGRCRHISGRFYGPGHEEAWGVFDTDAYVGAFGARHQ